MKIMWTCGEVLIKMSTAILQTYFRLCQIFGNPHFPSALALNVTPPKHNRPRSGRKEGHNSCSNLSWCHILQILSINVSETIFSIFGGVVPVSSVRFQMRPDRTLHLPQTSKILNSRPFMCQAREI